MSMCSDEKFKNKFWQDPALALTEAGIRVDPSTINLINNMDQAIISNLVQESQDILSRSQAFTWEGENPAVLPFAVAAAFLVGAAVGALVSEVLHHHFSEK